MSKPMVQRFLRSLIVGQNYGHYSFAHNFVVFTARPVTEKIKSLLLRRDEFETLNVIGRGAFGEV